MLPAVSLLDLVHQFGDISEIDQHVSSSRGVPIPIVKILKEVCSVFFSVLLFDG